MTRLQEISEELISMVEDEDLYKKICESKPELHDDLAECVFDNSFGDSLHHPLVIAVPFNNNPFGIHSANLMYEAKLIQKQEAKADKNLHQYIYLHERPYRVFALEEATHSICKVCSDWSENSELSGWISESEYWKLVADVWVDSENIYQNINLWRKLFTENFEVGSHLMMTETELKTYSELPELIIVHRGGRDDNGFSWTLDKDKAKWFANRWEQGDEVFSKVIKKSDVIAYLDGREEAEIIFMPDESPSVDIEQEKL